MIAPCKGCSDRFVGCHASCPRYAEFKAGCEARREARREARTKLHPIADYTIDITKRVQKAAHRRRK